MNNVAVKVSPGDFGGPVREWVFPPVDYVGEEKMASEREKNQLINLIVESVQDEEQCERWFEQIHSMTAADCQEAIFDFLTARMVIK